MVLRDSKAQADGQVEQVSLAPIVEKRSWTLDGTFNQRLVPEAVCAAKAGDLLFVRL